MNNNKQEIEVLAAQCELLRFTLDHVGAYVYTKDKERRYTYANAMVCELFGEPLEKIVGFTDDKFFDTSLSEELLQNDLRVLGFGERVESEESNVIAETGEERIYWVVKIPVRDPDGKIVGLCGISTDITERRRLEKEVVEQKNLLSQVLENMDAFVYIKDSDSRYLYVNENVANLFGLPADRIIGHLQADILPAETDKEFLRTDRAVFEAGRKVAAEEVINKPGGETMYCWSIKIPLFNQGEPDRLIGISTDITEIIELKNRYHHFASIDHLTGVLTRRFLFEQVERQLKQSQRRNARMGVLLIDLDLFKGVNDTYGHLFGDTYIKATVEACQRTLRTSDMMGRLGGDEFIIVIDDTDQSGIVSAAKRCLSEVLKTTIETPEGKMLSLSVSIGVALSGPSSTADQLIAKADSALYEAKKAGRGRLHTAPFSD